MSTQSSFSKWYRFVDLSSLRSYLTRWIMFIRQLNYLSNDLNCCLNDDDEFNDDNYFSNNLNCCLNDDDEFNDDNYFSNNLNCCLNDDDEFNDDSYLSNNLNCCLNDDDEFNDDIYLSNNLDCCLNDDDEFNDDNYLSNNSCCCLNDDDEFNDDNYFSNNSCCCLNDDDEFNDQWSISKIFDEKTTMSSLLLNRLTRQTCKINVQKKNYLWSEVVNRDIYVMITWMLMCAESIQRSDTFNISTCNVQKRIFIIINAHDEKRIQNLEMMKWFTLLLTLCQLRRRDLSYTSVQITINIRDLSSWAASTASTRRELYECTNYD
jgi:hypothetical protein